MSIKDELPQVLPDTAVEATKIDRSKVLALTDAPNTNMSTTVPDRVATLKAYPSSEPHLA